MNTQTRIALAAIAVVVPLAIIGVYGVDLAGSPAGEGPDRLAVITSFYPVHEFVQAVGGERVEATLLVPPGVEPHDWEPTVRDVQRMQSADLVVINGAGFEVWVEDVEENDEFDVVIVDTSAGIEVRTGGGHDEDHDDHGHEEDHDDHGDDDHGDGMHEREEDHDDHGDEMHDEREEDHDEDHDDDHDGDHGDDDGHEEDHHGHDHSMGDPHIWLSPVLAQVQVQNIADALAGVDPENAGYYHSNAAAYTAELDALDSRIRAGLDGCGTDFIAFHDAFAYFADEYGLVQHTILSSKDPHGEVTAGTLEGVISEAGELGLDVIFSEEAVNPKTAQVIADEIGGRVLILSPLEAVTDGTYVSKMDDNLGNLREALC